MKIAIYGTGAMGSIYAALLADCGNEVICIDRNAAHVNAINSHGIRVSGASGDRTVKVSAFTAPPDTRVDLLIVALKAADVPAIEDAKDLITGEGTVLTIQNGLGSAAAVAKLLGEDRLIVGIAEGFGASLHAPGHSHHNDMKAIRMGNYVTGSQANTQDVVAAFARAGFDCERTDDIAVIQWEKLICNVAYSGPCALTGMTLGEVLDDPLISSVSQAAAKEAWEIAGAHGINISIRDPIAYVTEFAERMRAAKPSVLLDIEAGRASEIEYINGAVATAAEQVGLRAPVNATITALVRSLEVRALKDKT